MTLGSIPSCMTPRATLFLLWFIQKREIHGYGILKALREGGMHGLGPGRLYPFLADMLKQGLISQKEKKTGRRVRKVYVITAKGRQMLEERRRLFRGLIREFVIDMLKGSAQDRHGRSKIGES